ncbi:MAG TPA: extracellular solute-binding protein [Propionicimonas sp.]|uniref:extracellular solute-binding protein n=1 Tax=Propionicimonas sp. TaxID=1955623 RepID=UPI002F3F2C90
MRTWRKPAAAVALVAAASLMAACSTGGGAATTGAASSAPASAAAVTLTWWHNSNTDPGKSYYEQVAKDYESSHPGVTIKIEAMAHQDMLTKLNNAWQSGTGAPDVYMERGGGELAAHVAADLTKDITTSAASTISTIKAYTPGFSVGDKVYALPFSMGIVGMWYNKALFAKAGITAAPTTIDELIAASDKLKKAGIQPIALGARDAWPAAHWWYYLALRSCSQDVLVKALADKVFTDPCFVAAGDALKKIVGAEPFNKGFLNTPAQEGATSASGLLANGKVAMELMGHWEPGVMQGLTDDKLGLGDDTGWFPFPAVDGGAGDPKAAIGGGDAWACSKNAPDACVEFISYLLSDKVQQGFAEKSMGLPTNPAASGSVADPVLADLLKARDAAPFVQLYFDTALGENISGAMNPAIVNIFAGKGTPQQVVDAMTKAAANE